MKVSKNPHVSNLQRFNEKFYPRLKTIQTTSNGFPDKDAFKDLVVQTHPEGELIWQKINTKKPELVEFAKNLLPRFTAFINKPDAGNDHLFIAESVYGERYELSIRFTDDAEVKMHTHIYLAEFCHYFDIKRYLSLTQVKGSSYDLGNIPTRKIEECVQWFAEDDTSASAGLVYYKKSGFRKTVKRFETTTEKGGFSIGLKQFLFEEPRAEWESGDEVLNKDENEIAKQAFERTKLSKATGLSWEQFTMRGTVLAQLQQIADVDVVLFDKHSPKGRPLKTVSLRKAVS